MSPKEVISEWLQIYVWDGGDASAEANEGADLLIDYLRKAGYRLTKIRGTDASNSNI